MRVPRPIPARHAHGARLGKTDVSPLHRLPLLAVLVLAGLAVAAPAGAHPFGPPQTAEVSAAGDRVRVQWRFGAADDVSYLAAALGVLPPERVLLDGVVAYEDGDAALLAAAPVLDDYVHEHVIATRAGETCEGEVQPTPDLAVDGVIVDFACPDGTAPVTVGVDMLADLHPAYRTLATGPGGQRAVYDAEAPEHSWQLSLDAGSGPGDALAGSAARQLGGVLAGLAGLGAVGGAGAWWWRRRTVRAGAA